MEAICFEWGDVHLRIREDVYAILDGDRFVRRKGIPPEIG